MKIQKQLSRKVGNKEYAKWVTVIPNDIIKQLHWTNKQEIIPQVKNGELTLKKAK